MMARVDAALRKAGKTPFAATPPSREPRLGAAPEHFTRQEIEEFLSRQATGWDPRVREMLSIPERLLVAREASNVLYSEDDRFGVAKVYGDLAHGRTPSEMPGYGIAIDGSHMDSVYFVLTDPARKIIVRERLSCIHSPVDFEWQAVAGKIEQAVEHARRTPEGFVTIVNGSLPGMIPVRK
jgi:hypothetical protein